MESAQMKHRALNFPVGSRSRVRSGYDYYIQTTIEYTFMQSVAFAHQPCDMVPHNAVSCLFAYGNSQSVSFTSIFQHIHYQQPIGIRSAISINRLKILIFFQAIRKNHVLSQKEKKATKLRPMRIISFFLLLFLQPVPFFRREYSFWL